MENTIFILIKKSIKLGADDVLKDLKNTYENYMRNGEYAERSYEYVDLINNYFIAKHHFINELDIALSEMDEENTKDLELEYGPFDCSATIEITSRFYDKGDRDIQPYREKKSNIYYEINYVGDEI